MTNQQESLLAKVLNTVRGELDDTIIPDLSDGQAKFSGMMVSELLSYLIAWDHARRDFLPEHTRMLYEQLDSIGAPVLVDQTDPGLPADVIPDLDGEYGRLQNSLDQLIATGRLTDLEAIVESDLRVFSHERTTRASADDALKSRRATMDANLTPTMVQYYLDRYHPDLLQGQSVSSVARFPGGYSKDTHIINIGVGEQSVSIVSRRDLPFGPGENTVVDEFDLLRVLHQQGFPVAKPLVCEKDPTHFGQPFLLSRRMPGVSGTTEWQDNRELRESICLKLAATLAVLHAQSPVEFGFNAVDLTSPRITLKAYIEEWRDRWLRRRVHSSPTLSAGYHWLLDHIPEHIQRVSLCHGDVGFHNVLVQEGEITALLDWEFAHPGDAMEDLCYARQLIEPLIDWNLFLNTYAAAGGVDYRPQDALFYSIWSQVRNATCCAVSWYGFISDAYPATKMAYQGIPLYRRFVEQVGLKLIEAGDLK